MIQFGAGVVLDLAYTNYEQNFIDFYQWLQIKSNKVP